MNWFDVIIMLIGAALIIVGVVIFVYGKVAPSKSNVEGFGFKLDISNPSILLIVFGVGLLLVPRLLPEGKVEPSVPIPAPTPASNPGPNPVAVTPAANIYLPSGIWNLTGYEENGFDASAAVSGQISFITANSATVQWEAQFSVVDEWGDVNGYWYDGNITSENAYYFINFVSSNDPSFTPQTRVPLTLMLESGNTLHLEYFSSGNQVIQHWR